MHNEQNNAVNLGLDGLVDLRLNAVPTAGFLLPEKSGERLWQKAFYK